MHQLGTTKQNHCESQIPLWFRSKAKKGVRDNTETEEMWETEECKKSEFFSRHLKARTAFEERMFAQTEFQSLGSAAEKKMHLIRADLVHGIVGLIFSEDLVE